MVRLLGGQEMAKRINSLLLTDENRSGVTSPHLLCLCVPTCTYFSAPCYLTQHSRSSANLILSGIDAHEYSLTKETEDQKNMVSGVTSRIRISASLHATNGAWENDKSLKGIKEERRESDNVLASSLAASNAPGQVGRLWSPAFMEGYDIYVASHW